MTTTRKWTIGAVLVIVLVMVATWFLLVSPKRDEAAKLRSGVDAQENINAGLSTQIAVLKDQKKDLPTYQARLAELQSRVPETVAMPGFIRELATAADQSGVLLKSLTPTLPVELADPSSGVASVAVPGAGLPAGALAGVDLDIVADGDFFAIQQFINKVENLQRYVLLDGLTVAEIENAGNSSDGPLAATLNGRVFLLPDATNAVAPTVVEPLAPPTTP